MNMIRFVMAAALFTATAACTQTGYDNSHAYNSNSSSYWRDGVYYNHANTDTAGYSTSADPFYSQSAAAAQHRPYGDQDRDGVRNRNESDANGDGIADFFQR